MISTSDFRNGSHIEVEGKIMRIIEFQHVKPGKGGAFVRTKLRRIEDGGVIDKTFRAGEKFELLHTNPSLDGEMCMATPALVGDRLLIRTDRHLFSIRNPSRQP